MTKKTAPAKGKAPTPSIEAANVVIKETALRPAKLSRGHSTARYDRWVNAPAPGFPDALPGAKGLPKRLEWARNSIACSLGTLGAYVGITAEAVQCYESGEHRNGPTCPKVDVAERMAEGLGVSPAWLLLGIGNPLPPKVGKKRAAQ